MTDPLARLVAAGSSVWLDGLSRARLLDGGLERLTATHRVSGAVLDPAVFADALTHGEDYEREVAELALTDAGVDEAVLSLTSCDARWACDVLAPAHEASQGVDGQVLVRIDPRLAHDAVRLAARVRSLWRLVGQPNLVVLVPATPPALRAASTCLAEGVSVGVGPVFAPERYARVQEAFLTGLERAVAQGRDIDDIASVALFSLSDLDSAVNAELERLDGTAEARRLRGRAAIASARLTYQLYDRMLSTPRWRSLAQEGANPQRLLWSGTRSQDARVEDTHYVEALVAPGTVYAMDEHTLYAVADHGLIPADAVRGSAPAARGVLDGLALRGVEINEVTEALERGTLTDAVAERARLADHLAAVMNGEIARFARGSLVGQSLGGGESFA